MTVLITICVDKIYALPPNFNLTPVPASPVRAAVVRKIAAGECEFPYRLVSLLEQACDGHVKVLYKVGSYRGGLEWC